MLLSFKVKNYLSFKDEAGFSMVANKKIRTLKNNKNIIKLKDGETIWLNKTAIFYGANASGKTNIFKGLDFLKDITLNSFSYPIEGGIKNIFLKSFLLNEENNNLPIEFEIDFILNKEKYSYGIKLDNKQILNEKLFVYKKNRKDLIFEFERITQENISLAIKGYTKDYFGEDISNIIPRNNQTLISILSNKDGKGEFLATKIIKFFLGINFINSKSDFTGMTLSMLKDEKLKDIIISFMKNADININNIKQEEKEVQISEKSNFNFLEINGQKVIPKNIVEVKTDFIHPVYDNEGTQIGEYPFDFNLQESEGTKKLFSFLGPILDTIKNNGVLLIDEIDTHMHFLLIENLINFFHSKNNNGKNNIGNSQFIFNTHNLDLMDLELFKKDQIYFTSKDYYGATEIFSLDDFKDMQIRNNSDIKKAYLNSVFGAVPILSDFNL